MRLNSVRRAQSAMEYLMTYGWAILIIAVVLASLFSLGVFSAGGSLGTACIAGSGFLCSSPLLHSNTLTVTVGQATGASWSAANVVLVPPTVTGGCLVAGALSNSISGGLASGASTSISFNPVNSILPATGAIGGTGSATIWVDYTAGGTSGLCVQIATITLKAV